MINHIFGGQMETKGDKRRQMVTKGDKRRQKATKHVQQATTDDNMVNEQGLHLILSPRELWGSRVDYQLFTRKVFRKHI
jgi:hypothetical protein